MLDAVTHSLATFDLHSYDRIVVALSGGKDSIASTLALLEAGVTPDKLIFFHHLVDGREGSDLFDWPSTEAYVAAFVAHIGGELWWTWREGGIEREMLRNNTPTAAVNYERAGTTHHLPGAPNAPLGVRMKFPQVAADLSVRYCSAAAKIDVADRVLRNDRIFANSRTLFNTGERAEESPQRSKYLFFEPHRADRRTGKSRRHIDHLRPVLHWQENEVWTIMKRHGIVAHPAYQAGFGRLSCRNCIFASDAQWATLAMHDPAGFEQIATYERLFNRTIHRKDDVVTRARRAKPFPAATQDLMACALAPSFEGPIAVEPAAWTLPAGAFAGHSGPS